MMGQSSMGEEPGFQPHGRGSLSRRHGVTSVTPELLSYVVILVSVQVPHIIYVRTF